MSTADEHLGVNGKDIMTAQEKAMANHSCTSCQDNSMEKCLLIDSSMVPNGRPPRPISTKNATGEEQRSLSSNLGCYDADGSKPSGSPFADVVLDERKDLRCMKTHQIATWNVRGMNVGKLDIIKNEMTRLNIDLLGISELHWTGNGFFKTDDFTIYYSGNDNRRQNGVAFIVNKKIAAAVEGYTVVSDRILAIRLRGKPINLTILQVYAPTSAASEDEIESFYSRLEESLHQMHKRDIVYVMGDFNAKIGAQKDLNITGGFGLGERNDAGDRLFQFCIENQLRIANTWFEQPKRRLYTWTSPDGVHRNQIDYILCNQRWNSSSIPRKPFLEQTVAQIINFLQLKLKLSFAE